MRPGQIRPGNAGLFGAGIVSEVPASMRPGQIRPGNDDTAGVQAAIDALLQ